MAATFGFTGTINGTDGGCGGDPDGDGLDNLCGDNCPDDFNPGQEDCDGDGFGDACDPEGDADGDDGDGVCQNVDNCLTINNPEQVDTDGDGKGDACDPCPIDRLDDQDNDGFCDSDEACDLDPLKQLPGQCGCGFLDDDSDGDGVSDCNDLCPGVDDAVFAPECEGAIPTTSQWGLIVLALLLLAGGKVYFGGRRLSANQRRS